MLPPRHDKCHSDNMAQETSSYQFTLIATKFQSFLCRHRGYRAVQALERVKVMGNPFKDLLQQHPFLAISDQMLTMPM